MGISATRRSLLGAIAVAPFAVSTISTAAAADDGTWDAALARAKAADLAYGEASIAEEEAGQRWYEACKAIRPAGLIDRKWASLETQLLLTPLDEIEGLYEPPHVHQFGGAPVWRRQLLAIANSGLLCGKAIRSPSTNS